MDRIDHLLVLAFAVVYPLIDLVRTPALKRAIARGEGRALVRDYLESVVLLWAFAVAAVAVWLWAGRELAALGLGAPGGWGFWLAAAPVVALSYFVVVLQPAGVARSDKGLDAVRGQLEKIAWYLPRNIGQFRAFVAVSITAGICEELLYRGYLIAYFESLWGIWVAVPLSTLLFGAAHLYVGVPAAVRATVAGLVFALLYLLTGSLWLPMLLHAALDLGSGRLALLTLGEDRAGART